MKEVDDAIERVAEFRCHPLGFCYLTRCDGNGSTQRVHVWLSRANRSRQEISNPWHQHSFDIHSVIQIGRVRSELFSFTETKGGTTREFRVDYKNSKSSVSATGRIGTLEPIAFFDSCAGDSYFLRAGIIHKVTIADPPCVTFLRTEERNISIYTYGEHLEEQPFERRLVNHKEKSEIAFLLSSLSQ